MQQPFYRTLALLAGLSGCASTHLTDLPRPASGMPAPANWGITDAGRYTFELEKGQYQMMRGEDGQELMKCPSGYQEFDIPGTPAGVDAKECRQPAHHSQPIPEEQYRASEGGCERPRAVALVNGSYECVATCPAGKLPIPKSEQGYDVCE